MFLRSCFFFFYNDVSARNGEWKHRVNIKKRSEIKLLAGHDARMHELSLNNLALLAMARLVVVCVDALYKYALLFLLACPPFGTRAISSFYLSLCPECRYAKSLLACAVGSVSYVPLIFLSLRPEKLATLPQLMYNSGAVPPPPGISHFAREIARRNCFLHSS